MAERSTEGGKGGFGGDRGFGGKGKGKGGKGKGGKGKGGKGKGGDKEEWIPCTKLGRLVKDGKIRNVDDIYYFCMPIKEYQIIDFFMPSIKDEVMKIHPVQKQTTAGQRTRFKAFVVVGDNDGHVGLGVKAAKEVATAIRGAIIAAKMNVIPVARGHWGNKIGAPHTIPCKVHGKCGSIRIRMIPAPRGTGLVAAKIPKKVLGYAGVEDCFTSSRGATATGGNFVKAVFEAVKATYQYNTPDVWDQVDLAAKKPPFQEFTDYLKTAEIKAPVVKSIFN
jgi:small subunit ribosomal protein S2e